MRPEPFVETELRKIDRWLRLEWDPRYEVFWLMSRRGQEVVCYGPWAPSDLNQRFLEAVREAVWLRDHDETVHEGLARRGAAAREEAERGWKELHDAHEAFAHRVADAGSPHAKIHAPGSKVVRPHHGDTRVEAVKGAD